jgi:hypothetical protein
VEAIGYEIYQGDVPNIAAAQPPPIELTPTQPPIPSPRPSVDPGKKTNGPSSSKAVTVAGNVLGPGGSEVAEADVRVQFGTAQRRGSSDSNGSFRVYDVILGPDMQIRVSAKGYKTSF